MTEDLIRQLNKEKRLSKEEWITLLKEHTPKDDEVLFSLANELRKENFGNGIYTRGLIEFTNFCKNDCYYCGIRRSNQRAKRFRLTREDILACCREGYAIGFRTFVLQGGEDPYFTDEKMCDVVGAIRSAFPDCAITLSLGERSRESYEALFAAGANRYLLRHETANEAHYRKLHPEELSLQHRMECLRQLKEIGYQVGCGFMVGSPGQTVECLAEDFLFLQEFQPHMVGIGPFVPHGDTPLGKERAGSVDDTLFYLALLRVMMPKVLLPATTALGTLDPAGREKGILAGANVVMPNLSPHFARDCYELYDNKLKEGAEAEEVWNLLEKRMEEIGCRLLKERGDFPSWERV